MPDTTDYYDLKNEEEAKKYLKNIHTEYIFQCQREKSYDGCHRLGSFLESVKKDLKGAFEIYQTNCIENKHGASCFKLGSFKLLGRACEKSEEDALKCFEIGCDDKDGASCHNAALINLQRIQESRAEASDIKKVEDFLTKACNYKDMESCYRLSGLYIDGKRLPKNMPLAFKYALQACERDNPYACANVSRMYLLGEGVEKSLEMSKHFKDRAKNLINSSKEKGILSGDNVSNK